MEAHCTGGCRVHVRVAHWDRPDALGPPLMHSPFHKRVLKPYRNTSSPLVPASRAAALMPSVHRTYH